jgi:hypothetical protein
MQVCPRRVSKRLIVGRAGNEYQYLSALVEVVGGEGAALYGQDLLVCRIAQGWRKGGIYFRSSPFGERRL